MAKAISRTAIFRFAAPRRILLSLLFVATVDSAEGHDFWISPEPIEPTAGQTVLLRLFAGEEFEGDEVPYEAARALRFQHLTGTTMETLAGREGYSPAAFLRDISPGVHLIGYASSGTDILLEPQRFNRYLEEEGLTAILENRRRNGRLSTPGRERFFRYAKALIVTPGANQDPSTSARVLGQRLEIVPEFDPVEIARKRAPIRVRVLYEGKPLQGATVMAMSRSDPQAGQLKDITDPEGRVAFELDRTGEWMLSLIWMVPGSLGAEWESFWGSLVFAVG